MTETRYRLWWQRKRTWFAIGSVLFLMVFIWSLPSQITGIVLNTVKAYSDPNICEGALKIAQNDPKVIEVLGELDPVGKMALFEGYVRYSKNGDSVDITINVKGDKYKNKISSKMDIHAIKDKNEWEYQKIQIRIKKPIEKKQTLVVLEN